MAGAAAATLCPQGKDSGADVLGLAQQLPTSGFLTMEENGLSLLDPLSQSGTAGS